MTSLFTKLDADHDGYLNISELRLGLEKYYQETGSLAKDDWDTLLANFDLDGIGQISFHDWIAVVEDREAMLSNENIAQVFKMIDTSGGGKISVSELINFLEMSLGDMDEVSI